jgi:phospho-N-acetylmuramoyl-pentapeptide-transferase
VLKLLLEAIRDQVGWLHPADNLLRYITFRSAMAAVTALLIGILLGPGGIGLLTRLKLGQPIRGKGIPDLYERHKGKAGTPTMGGVLILAAIAVSVLLWGDLRNRLVWIALGVTLWLGAIGFWDDWLKLKAKHYKGLSKNSKLAGQTLLGLLVGTWLYFDPLTPSTGTALTFPFFKHFIVDIGILYIPFVMLVLTATSNAVNLTDGLDGLATGCVIAASLPYVILAYVVGRTDFSRFLLIDYVPGCGELTVFVAATVGASMAFLWFNSHPAEVFMGDTGSLALGGALGITAVLVKQEMLLPIIGGVFVAEALSVMIQVFAVRRFKKRVFLMSPIHHHFEMKGWAEAKIITRFWIISALLGIFGLATLKMR